MGDGHPVLQRYKDIIVTGQQHIHALAPQRIAQIAGEVQHQVFFIQPLALRAGVDAAVAGVQHDGKAVLIHRRGLWRGGERGGPIRIHGHARGLGKNLRRDGFQRNFKPRLTAACIHRHADFCRDHRFGQIRHQPRPPWLKRAKAQGRDAARFLQ